MTVPGTPHDAGAAGAGRKGRMHAVRTTTNARAGRNMSSLQSQDHLEATHKVVTWERHTGHTACTTPDKRPCHRPTCSCPPHTQTRPPHPGTRVRAPHSNSPAHAYRWPHCPFPQDPPKHAEVPAHRCWVRLVQNTAPTAPPRTHPLIHTAMRCRALPDQFRDVNKRAARARAPAAAARNLPLPLVSW